MDGSFLILVGVAIIWWLVHRSRASTLNLKTRVRRDEIGGTRVYKIEAQGPMPVDKVTIRWECRLIDDQTGMPIWTVARQFQENDSAAYLFQSREAYVPNGGIIPEWSPVAFIPGEIALVAPYKGRRSVRIVLDLDWMSSSFRLLGLSGTTEWKTVKQFNHLLNMDFGLPGYVEKDEKRKEARVLTVKLAVGMALADGHLDRAEDWGIHRWVRRCAGEFDDDEAFRAFEEACNKARRETAAQVRAGYFSLAEVARKLVDVGAYVGKPVWKYEAIELLHRIAAADKVAQEEELQMLRKLSDLLGLDPNEVEKIRDREFMDLPVDDLFSGSILTELGIPEDASPGEIKKELRKAFQKWNNALNTFPEGKREYVQQMIDRIAEARKKYD